MNVSGLIEQYNTERPNNIEDQLKVEWLKRIEQTIVDIVIKNHQGAPDDEILDEHLRDFDLFTELLVEEPYDDVYFYYLDQRIALNNNDTKRYNVASQLYNNAMLTYQQKYNREHLTLKHKKHLLRHEVL